MSVPALPLPAAAETLAMHEEADPLAAWVVVSVLVLGVTLAGTLRVSAADERLVVRRRGRTVRVRGPGMALVVPGLDRAVRLSLQPRVLGPLWVSTRTSDAVTVQVSVSAQVRIVDPVRAAAASTCCPAGVLERAVVAEVERLPLADLARRPEEVAAAVVERCGAASATMGARFDAVAVHDIECKLDTHLLAWAERRAGARGAC